MPYSVTERQRDALLFLHDFHTARGRMPSRAELAASLGLKSKSNAHEVIVDLEERGWIARDRGGNISLLTARPNWRNRYGIALGYSIAPEQTPGEYLRKCRVAAGKSIAECAAQIAAIHADRVHAAEDLAALESNQPGDYGRLTRQLKERAVFPFDFATFASLAAATCDPSLDELEAA
ncbi:LexA family protein [Aurantiacibacter suaedae]|uniref:LexA family protein n=1 Tax=Aurantiacibacter suaedae TaxID=2545755 RepID=UPI00138752C7|nr:hypothetical protein [Aurantiacibacter suaedae]